MKEFIQVLRRFVPPYKKFLFLSILFNILSAILNVFSFTLIIPILQILFKMDTKTYEFIPWDAAGINMKDIAVNNFYYYVTEMIASQGGSLTLLILGVFLAVMTLLKAFSYFASSAVMIPLRTGVVRDIRAQVYNKVLHLPLSFFSEERKGDIIARMSGDVTEVETSVTSSLDMLIKNPILIIAYFGTLIAISWQLTLFTIVFVPVFGWFMGVVGRKLKAKSIKAQALWSDTMSQVEETLGGLRIIATERHESRRIDNQLRGRSGRQGDPGESRFYLSLEDPLMKIFAGERLNAIMVRLKMPEGEAIEAGMVTRSLETAQRKVEQRNFDIRKQLLEYDDVSNDQRKVIYQQRNELLETTDITETITAMREGVLHDVFRIYVPVDSVEEQWDIPGLELALESDYQLKLPVGEWIKADPSISDDDILSRLLDAAAQAYADKVALVDPTAWHGFERNVMLQSLDTHWREHLSALDHLRQGIHLRGYAQKNPKQEYKREAFELFENLLQVVRTEVTKLLMTVQIRSEAQIEEAEMTPALENVQYHHADYDEALATANPDRDVNQPETNLAPKVGRNDPCPCGSGKKYKHCHGKLS